MNWVDLAIIVIIFLFALEGIRRPFFFELFDLLGFTASFLISLRFYNLVSGQLSNFLTLPHSFTNVLGFIIVWYLVETGMFFLARFLYKFFNKFTKFPGEKALSFIPATLKGLVFVSIILVLLVTLPVQPKIKKDVNSAKIGSAILSYTYQLEAPLKSAFGGFASDTLSFLTIKTESHESVGLGFQNNKFNFDEVLEQQMIDKVNQERASRGLTVLIADPSLTLIARQHSADMFRQGYFSHDNAAGQDVAGRAVKANISYQVIGENLAYAPTLDLAHNGLMNSPGHKANILAEDFHRIGIGIANGDEYGLMITQVFKN